MTTQRAIDLANTWYRSGVCTLKEGEAEEYHKMFLKMLHKKKKKEENKPLSLDELKERYFDENTGHFVFIKDSDGYVTGAILDIDDTGICAVYNSVPVHTEYVESNYGERWLAYKYRPQED